MERRHRTITLIGSGEFSESMAKVYRSILAPLAESVRAVFVDTPAGFEVNIDEISAKAVDYFSRHFSIPMQVASFKSSERATPESIADAVEKLVAADLILAGPGSPTYAIRQWRGSRIWETLIRRFNSGGQLVLASAAAISISRLALPVYEIYKAGQDPHWVPGLDLLSAHGLDLVVVPHWNNTEGGQYDTRYCFMGPARFEELARLVPPSTTILGIDEYTACIVDLEQEECRVMGSGQVTLRHSGQEEVYSSGSAFPLGRLRGATLRNTAQIRERPAPPAETEPDAAEELQRQVDTAYEDLAAVDAESGIIEASDRLHKLTQALHRARQAGLDERAREPAYRAARELALEIADRAVRGGMTPHGAPLIDLLIEVRAQLRESREFDLADQVRQGLQELGIVVEDTPTGTQWHRAMNGGQKSVGRRQRVESSGTR
jgi:peptidase E